jgi:cell division protease FtsH
LNARQFLFPLVIIAALVWLAAQTLGGSDSKESLRFSEALAFVRQSPGQIARATFRPSTHEIELRLRSGKTRTTVYPVDASAYELQQLLEDKGVAFDAKRVGSSAWWSILTSLLPFVLLFGFWILLMRKVRNAPTGSGSQETQSPR